MLRLTIAGLILFILPSCTEQNPFLDNDKKVTEKRFRFYDFNVTVDILNPYLGHENRFLILNNGMDLYDEQGKHITIKDFKPQTLYYISYKRALSNRNRIEGIDTTVIELKKEQLDTIYYLTVKLFNIDTANLSKDTIPPP